MPYKQVSQVYGSNMEKQGHRNASDLYQRGTKYIQKKSENHPIISKVQRAGHGIWMMLHMLARHFSNSPSKFAEIVEKTFQEVVPCPKCRAESLNYLLSNPITENTSPISWICRYHNKVNLTLGKLVFPCEAISVDTPSAVRHMGTFNRPKFVDMGYYID